ncbi:hypothetical protein LCGC14_0595810 [marine sediment metagenome]|uniref:Uncharacterized protein n=1 Tax=marine sediment metagenome TaxID=412755 RepID=A0A0F9RVT2_9ZZZZ
MSEEDIKRIEKKVDLLYKMKVNEGINFSSEELDEIIPLFDLSIKTERIKGLITEEELIKEQQVVGEKLKKQLNVLNDDTISVKEHNELAKGLPDLIYNLKQKNEGLLEDFKRIEYCKENLYKELFMISLKEKLGIELPKGESYSYNIKVNLEDKFWNYIKNLEDELKNAIEVFKLSLKEYREEYKGL